MNKTTGQFLEQLWNAVHSADPDEVRKMLVGLSTTEATEIVNTVPAAGSGRTPFLHVAINQGSLPAISLLLEYRADTEAKDEITGETALGLALRLQNNEVEDLLLANGADILACDGSGTRIIDLALASRRFDIVEKCLEKGASLDHRNAEGTTMLHHAAVSGNLEYVRRVLDETDFTPGEEDGTGRRPLDDSSSQEVFDFLCRLDPELPLNKSFSSGNHSIHTFAARGQVEIVSTLLDHGVDINLRGNHKNSLVHYATKSGKPGLLRLLVEKGLDVNSRNTHNERPLHWAASAGHVGMLSTLLELGANMDIKTRYSSTPLFWAVEKNRIEAARWLLEHGADVNAVNDDGGTTALVRACRNNHLPMIELLLDHGANPNGMNVRDSSVYPIDFRYFPLAEVRSVEALNLLLEAGADVNGRNEDYWTALHEIVYHAQHEYTSSNQRAKYLAIIRILLEAGADVNARDRHGRGTPLAMAKDREIAGLLLAYKDQQPKERSPETERAQKKQDSFLQSLLSLVGYKGKDYDLTPFGDTGTGEELLKMAFDVNSAERLDAIDAVIQRASKKDLNASDSYDFNETLLVRLAAGTRNAFAYDIPLRRFRKTITLLIDKGADVNKKGGVYGNTPLISVASVMLNDCDRLEDVPEDRDEIFAILKLLLDAGAKVNKQNDDKNTALDFVMHREARELLTARGARYGDGANQALFMAIVEKKEALMHALLDQGVPLNGRNGDGYTVLDAALSRDNPDLMLLLIEKGADLYYLNEDGQGLFINACRLGAFTCVKVIAEQLPVDLNQQDEDGYTALHWLMDWNEPELYEGSLTSDQLESRAYETAAWLIREEKVRLNITDHGGKTPVDRLTKKGAKALKPLLDTLAIPDAKAAVEEKAVEADELEDILVRWTDLRDRLRQAPPGETWEEALQRFHDLTEAMPPDPYEDDYSSDRDSYGLTVAPPDAAETLDEMETLTGWKIPEALRQLYTGYGAFSIAGDKRVFLYPASKMLEDIKKEGAWKDFWPGLAEYIDRRCYLNAELNEEEKETLNHEYFPFGYSWEYEEDRTIFYFDRHGSFGAFYFHSEFIDETSENIFNLMHPDPDRRASLDEVLIPSIDQRIEALVWVVEDWYPETGS